MKKKNLFLILLLIVVKLFAGCGLLSENNNHGDSNDSNVDSYVSSDNNPDFDNDTIGSTDTADYSQQSIEPVINSFDPTNAKIIYESFDDGTTNIYIMNQKNAESGEITLSELAKILGFDDIDSLGDMLNIDDISSPLSYNACDFLDIYGYASAQHVEIMLGGNVVATDDTFNGYAGGNKYQTIDTFSRYSTTSGLGVHYSWHPASDVFGPDNIDCDVLDEFLNNCFIPSDINDMAQQWKKYIAEKDKQGVTLTRVKNSIYS